MFIFKRVNCLFGPRYKQRRLRPGERKIKAVADFPTPANVHEIRQFIGLASYFRKFVKNFAILARPLTHLTAKDVDWQWVEAQQRAFDELRQRLTTRPILASYCGTAATELHTDASKLGLGGILYQVQTTGRLQAVAYYSRATTKAKDRSSRSPRFDAPQSKLPSIEAIPPNVRSPGHHNEP